MGLPIVWTKESGKNYGGAPATNRLASDGNGFNYTYDAAGNQTNAPGYTYAYEGANRLKTVNGAAASYGYDGDGMKSCQTSGGNAIFHVRSSVLGNVAMEVNATAGVYRAYVYAGGKLVAQRGYDGQFYWMHQDHLGSGRKRTDATGAVKYRVEFDPYGQLVLSWSASGYDNLNSKRFTGYERDTAAGLDYANARMYSASEAGRFMQPDPIGLKAADSRSPQSLNRYSYVENDPMNSTDPNGTNKSSVSCMRLRSWYDWDDGAREFFYTWYCYNNPDITVEGGDVGSQGGSYSSSVGNELIDQINALSRIDKCADAFGFKDDPLKKDRWIDHIRRGDVMFYHFRDTQPIPGNPLAANVVDYYYAARNVANSGSWGIQAEVNGVTVVSSLNPQVWDARKYNMIIVGPTAIPNVTTFYEFLHWESNAGHIAIADKLNLKLRGYSYSNEQEGRDAINDFIKNKCADKPKP